MAIFAAGRTVPKILRTALATTALGLAACSVSQAAPASASVAVSEPIAEAPAVWTVSDADTTIHLFGFTQVLKPGQEWRSAALDALIAGADHLVMENDPTDQQAQMAVQQLIPQIGLNRDGRTLSSMLTQAQAADVKAVADGLGLPMQAIDSMRPWLASIQLGAVAVGRQGYDLQSPLPAQIAAIAGGANVPIRALEQPADLMQIIAALPEEVQVSMLMHAVHDIKAGRDRTAPVNEAWLKGDVEQIAELLHGSDGAWADQQVYDAMLVERNRAWVAEIRRLLDEEEGVVVVAVGLGHLAGPDSLQSMLAENGHVVTQ